MSDTISVINSYWYVQFGKTLKQARRRAGLSQDAFALLVGVHAKTVLRWERGAYLPNYPNFKRLLRALEKNASACRALTDYFTFGR